MKKSYTLLFILNNFQLPFQENFSEVINPKDLFIDPNGEDSLIYQALENMKRRPKKESIESIMAHL